MGFIYCFQIYCVDENLKAEVTPKAKPKAPPEIAKEKQMSWSFLQDVHSKLVVVQRE